MVVRPDRSEVLDVNDRFDGTDHHRGFDQPDEWSCSKMPKVRCFDEGQRHGSTMWRDQCQRPRINPYRQNCTRW